MTALETKKIIIQRIISHLNPVPANAVNDLLQQSIGELEVILDKLATTKAQGESKEVAIAYAEESRRASAFEGAWSHTLLNVWLNGKQRLVDCESNKKMLESMLQPHETPSAAIYSTIALSYPTNFSWELPKVQPTKEDQRKAFDAFVREYNLSSVEANFNLFKEGASVEHYAGASGIERARYASEAAQARQRFLIHNATPSQLKAEAAYQSATEHDAAQRAEADRRHQFVLSQQSHYPPLPPTNANGEVIDAAYLRKTSTINFPLFKALVKKFGSGNVTARLCGEN